MLQTDTMTLMGMVKHCQSSQKGKFVMSLQYLKKEVRDEVDFLHADKHQSFLQLDFNTLGIKVFYKVVLSLLMGMIKHSQSTQNSKFAISLQYLKKNSICSVFLTFARCPLQLCFLKMMFCF